MTADSLIEVDVGIAVDIVNGGLRICYGVKMYMPMSSNDEQALERSKLQNDWQWFLKIVWMGANSGTLKYFSFTSYPKPQVLTLKLSLKYLT